MPQFRAYIRTSSHIDLDANDMYHADVIIRNMNREQLENQMVLDYIDVDSDEFPEEIG